MPKIYDAWEVFHQEYCKILGEDFSKNLTQDILKANHLIREKNPLFKERLLFIFLLFSYLYAQANIKTMDLLMEKVEINWLERNLRRLLLLEQ